MRMSRFDWSVCVVENYFHIFILVVSSAMLLRDVSARACDVSMGISVFPIG